MEVTMSQQMTGRQAEKIAGEVWEKEKGNTI